MCRNIRPLHNYDPPTSEEEVQAAALQYVRKISGMNRPARANEEAFERAVQAVTEASSRLLRELVTTAPPRDRAARDRARTRAQRRALRSAHGLNGGADRAQNVAFAAAMRSGPPSTESRSLHTVSGRRAQLLHIGFLGWHVRCDPTD